MSISEIVIKVVGIVLAIFGLFIILSSVAGLPGSWIAVLGGLACLAIGVFIVRGGSFTL